MTSVKADPKLTHVAVQWKHSSPLISCRFEPLGRFVFATAQDMTVQRWELSSGKKVSFPAVHDSWVRGLAFLPDGKTLITGGYDGRLMWWPALAEKPEPFRQVDAHPGPANWIRALSVSPDGRLLASGANDSLVKLWNADDGTLVREFRGHKSNVYSVQFDPSGKFLLSGDLLGQVKQWDVAAGTLVSEFDAKALHTHRQQVHYGGVRSIAISADGKDLVCGGLHKGINPQGATNEPLVIRFDMESQKTKQSHVTSDVKGLVWRALFHPDGHLIAAVGGGRGGFLLFWKSDQDMTLFKLKLPNTARDLDLHPDGLQLATAHYDHHLRISRMTAKPPAKKPAPKKKG
jgi:WD40 repeat protein